MSRLRLLVSVPASLALHAVGVFVIFLFFSKETVPRPMIVDLIEGMKAGEAVAHEDRSLPEPGTPALPPPSRLTPPTAGPASLPSLPLAPASLSLRNAPESAAQALPRLPSFASSTPRAPALVHLGDESGLSARVLATDAPVSSAALPAARRSVLAFSRPASPGVSSPPLELLHAPISLPASRVESQPSPRALVSALPLKPTQAGEAVWAGVDDALSRLMLPPVDRDAGRDLLAQAGRDLVVPPTIVGLIEGMKAGETKLSPPTASRHASLPGLPSAPDSVSVRNAPESATQAPPRLLSFASPPPRVRVLVRLGAESGLSARGLTTDGPLSSASLPAARRSGLGSSRSPSPGVSSSPLEPLHASISLPASRVEPRLRPRALVSAVPVKPGQVGEIVRSGTAEALSRMTPPPVDGEGRRDLVARAGRDLGVPQLDRSVGTGLDPAPKMAESRIGHVPAGAAAMGAPQRLQRGSPTPGGSARTTGPVPTRKVGSVAGPTGSEGGLHPLEAGPNLFAASAGEGEPGNVRGEQGDRLALAPQGGQGAEYGSYLVRVRQRIHQSLSYPRLARRQGLAGTVYMEIVIQPNGTISSVVLLRSSSHQVLDKAALDTVRRLPRLPFPAELVPRTLRVRLPVVFELR